MFKNIRCRVRHRDSGVGTTIIQLLNKAFRSVGLSSDGIVADECIKVGISSGGMQMWI